MSYNLLFEKANNLYLSGALNQAEQLYRQILSVMPENPDALNMLGLIAQAKACHQEAISLFYMAIKSAPHHLPIYFNLAVSLEAKGLLLEAIEAYEKILAKQPNIKEVYNNLGGIYEKLQKKEQAATAYRQAISLDENYINPLVNLAVLENNHQALQDLAEKFPSSSLPFYHLASDALETNDIILAIKHVSKANEQDNNSYEIKLLAGLIHLNAKDFTKAKTFFAEALSLNPQCVPAIINLANLEQNEQLYQKALELEPHNLEAHANYAAFLYQEKRTLEALEEYRKAVIINPNLPELSNNLGLILKDLNEYEQALDLFFNAFIQNPQIKAFSTNIMETLILLHRTQPEKAVKIAQNWLKIAPQNPISIHTLASFNGQNSGLSSQYSEELFDGFAATYDTVMQNIKYNIINKIKTLDIQFKGNILDLGCGTGLVGQALKSSENQFIGVDISQNMLDIASTKKVYTQLIKADIFDYLTRENLKFDVVLAVDVFDYIENIEKVISALPQTTLLFSIENAPKDIFQYQLTPTGRYQHNPDYIHQLLKKHGYQKNTSYELTLREEDGKPVLGTLFACKL